LDDEIDGVVADPEPFRPQVDASFAPPESFTPPEPFTPPETFAPREWYVGFACGWNGRHQFECPTRHYEHLETRATGIEIPLFVLFCFIVKLGSVVVDQITRRDKRGPRQSRTGPADYNWWCNLYCGTCAHRNFIVYLSENWPNSMVKCCGLCECGNCFSRAEKDGGGYFYVDLVDAKIQLSDAKDHLEKRAYIKNDTFRYLSQWNKRRNHQGDEMAKSWFLSRSYSASAQHLAKGIRNHAASMEDFLLSLPGFVKVIVDDPAPDGKTRTE
jgi:hypothetical protein